MSWYNHFSDNKFKQIEFSSVKVGERFRVDRFKNKRRRKDVIMIKTSELSFEELKSKKKTNVARANFMVSHYSELN